MDFSELLKKRRSIRKYKQREVPPATVMDIIQDSCIAPSARNDQPWKFIIVTNKALIKKISDESKENLLSIIKQSREPRLTRYEELLRNEDFNVFYDAPVLVFITGPKDYQSVYVDCALAAAYFMFSAAERGLGTCWIGLGADIRNSELRKEIGLTKDLVIVAPMILGYPESIPDMPERNKPQVLKIVS
ncbi:MAG: nitroreductase family protein [Desulfobacterales bacterium]|nr:nitroreductase family protein [Desulfobacterales bacterium]